MSTRRREAGGSWSALRRKSCRAPVWDADLNTTAGSRGCALLRKISRVVAVLEGHAPPKDIAKEG